MKYEQPIVDITRLCEDDIILTSLITDGDGYTDGDFKADLGGQM